MSVAFLYPLLTLATGLILLLAWVYFTATNRRSGKLLLKSIAFFVLPSIAIVGLPDQVFEFPLIAWLLILFEEALKATAAATEREPTNRFWLVILFGIWELMLAKTVFGIAQVEVLAGATYLQLVGLAAAGLMTVLMHAVTAEIYGFRFGGRIPAALAVSWAFHIAFNESADLLGVASLLLLVPLVFLFLALWPTGSDVTTP